MRYIQPILNFASYNHVVHSALELEYENDELFLKKIIEDSLDRIIGIGISFCGTKVLLATYTITMYRGVTYLVQGFKLGGGTSSDHLSN